MERLWTPWRLSYVTGASDGAAGCIFCDAAVPGGRDAALVLVRGRFAYVILNRYPYNNGHLMVVINRHVASLQAATHDELAEVMQLTRHSEIALSDGYHPHGINVGINLGRPAGAGALERRHQLHIDRRECPRAARGARADGRSAAADLRAAGSRGNLIED
jgi:ATP adenylyltransferase